MANRLNRRLRLAYDNVYTYIKCHMSEICERALAHSSNASHQPPAPPANDNTIDRCVGACGVVEVASADRTASPQTHHHHNTFESGPQTSTFTCPTRTREHLISQRPQHDTHDTLPGRNMDCTGSMMAQGGVNNLTAWCRLRQRKRERARE